MADPTPLRFPKVSFTGYLTPDAAKLIDKFVALNQHSGDRGKMTPEKLVGMLLSDVCDATKNGDTWQGGHMAITLSMHG